MPQRAATECSKYSNMQKKTIEIKADVVLNFFFLAYLFRAASRNKKSTLFDVVIFET